MSAVMNSLLTAETKAAHRARWFVYAASEKIPYQSTMRGTWGFDVECSCGWKSATGGGLRRYIEEQLGNHRWIAQCEAERSAE